MKNIFHSLMGRREKSVASVNIGRKLKHVIFIGIIVITAIVVIVSKLPKTEETVPEEEPIESYDNITEIEIVFDEETTAESIIDIDD